jgi:hypothetical protein
MSAAPYPPGFDAEMSLGEARELLRELVGHGCSCPCCTQFAKVYERKINSTMARTLITLFRAASPGTFVHTPSLPGDTHEASQLEWWKLIEEESVRRPDGGRAGWWCVTDLGVQFARREIALPKYARIYDHRCLGLTDEPVNIVDCLGQRFDYAELMGWTL